MIGRIGGSWNLELHKAAFAGRFSPGEGLFFGALLLVMSGVGGKMDG